MEIILNGDAKQVPQQSSIKDLLVEIGVLGGRVAIELNQEVVPKSEYASQQLQAADQIEIIQAVGRDRLASSARSRLGSGWAAYPGY